MQLSSGDASKYPKLRYYLKHNMPVVWAVPAIAQAFKKFGHIGQSDLKKALQWGVGPTVKVADLVGAFGEFTPDVKSHEIRVKRTLVEDFEAGKDVRVVKAGKVFLVGVTILHELVHWAEDQKGVDFEEPSEEGNDFEVAVYGKVVV